MNSIQSHWFSRLCVVIIGLCLTFAVVAPTAIAADVDSGAQIFAANCAACHAGGRNIVNPAKTLSQADLEAYGMNSLDAIKTQVTQGKAAMPAFGGRLTPDQIESVALYVLDQAEKGW
jgi:cytochrome c6